MGLLDSVLGAALGGGGAQGGGGQAALIQAVIGMLTQGGGQQGGGALGGLGGLGALVQMFQKGGLGDVAASWVGTGQNLPVSPEQLQNVLPADMLGGLAQQLGMNQGDLLGQLSQLLPQLVDQATPQGQIPADGGLGNLGGLIGSLLGGQR